MAQLPADRTKLAIAQANQTPGLVASATANSNALTESYDTIDLLYQYMNQILQGIYDSGKFSRLGIINVKDAPFNAKGDGVTDDTAAVKSAIAYLTTTFSAATSNLWRGGVLYFPPGVYRITEPLVLTMNIKLLGYSIDTWKVYDKAFMSSTLRFYFTNKQQNAISFVGYNPDGTRITNNYITTEYSASVVGNPDNVAIENMVIEADPNDSHILLGVDMVNTPNSRMVNVAIRRFKYGVLANCNWGASFDKLFILCRYGGILNYIGNNGVSINDSYITVTGTDIPIEDAIVPEISNSGNNPLKSFGILIKNGSLDIKNVIIEQCRVAIKAYQTRVNINLLHCENIFSSILETDSTILNLNMLYLFNNPATAVPLLVATTSSQVSIRGTFSNVATDINATASCSVSVAGTNNVTYTNLSPIVPVDVTLSGHITFDAGVSVEGGINEYAYRNGRTVMINFHVFTATTKTTGTVVPVGTIPSGFRPFTDLRYYTRYGVVRINTDGTISITMTADNTFILYETISYLI